jgi:hypothetical protein
MSVWEKINAVDNIFTALQFKMITLKEAIIYE